MGTMGGHVVQTPDEAKPYKVVLDNSQGSKTEHPVSTIREGEEFIKENSPPPIQPGTMPEWNPAR